MTGCRCRACWGFAEYMHELTGRDYGLPAMPPVVHGTTAEPKPEPPPPRREQARQPWEPRPPRSRPR